MTPNPVSQAQKTAGEATGGGPLTDLAHSEAADRLKEEVRDYFAAQAERVLSGVGHKLGEATGKLDGIAQGDSPGLASLALDGGRKLAEGKGPLRSALEMGASRAKDSVTGALKNLGGGSKRKDSPGKKPTVIIEQVDVGVPLRTAYDQWTQYQDFSSFAKGVTSASRADDVESDWRLKILWSSRSWKASTTEQVPDDRIVWTSEGAKGTTKGVVSFHRIADSLTRIVLVIEYYPAGFFEKTGNIWRAQGRRTRLDLKNFARYISLKGEEPEGWRGEISDGEVVVSHEDAVAEEENDGEDNEGEGNEEEENEGEAEYEDDELEDAEDAEDADASYEDEPADGEEDGYDDEAAYEEVDEEDEEDEEAPRREQRSRR
ncbi:SRPBCC family protein [Streptomyces sp. NPDC091377]|uniref:SRPBCC family protein n=1 Tax=Streptomyces sp. NPDC091377 TaxID=3365995 RepID=UPI003825FACB